MATRTETGSTRAPSPSRTLRVPKRASRRSAHGLLSANRLAFRCTFFGWPAFTVRGAAYSTSCVTARPIKKGNQVFSRIHVEDIASVLEASMARPRAGAIYNVADDEPAAPGEVVAYAAEMLGMTPPPEVPFEEADLTPMARSFYEGSRRIGNPRIKSELGVELRYPTYREGLASLLEHTS